MYDIESPFKIQSLKSIQPLFYNICQPKIRVLDELQSFALFFYR